MIIFTFVIQCLPEWAELESALDAAAIEESIPVLRVSLRPRFRSAFYATYRPAGAAETALLTIAEEPLC